MYQFPTVSKIMRELSWPPPQGRSLMLLRFWNTTLNVYKSKLLQPTNQYINKNKRVLKLISSFVLFFVLFAFLPAFLYTFTLLREFTCEDCSLLTVYQSGRNIFALIKMFHPRSIKHTHLCISLTNSPLDTYAISMSRLQFWSSSAQTFFQKRPFF